MVFLGNYLNIKCESQKTNGKHENRRKLCQIKQGLFNSVFLIHSYYLCHIGNFMNKNFCFDFAKIYFQKRKIITI